MSAVQAMGVSFVPRYDSGGRFFAGAGATSKNFRGWVKLFFAIVKASLGSTVASEPSEEIENGPP